MLREHRRLHRFGFTLIELLVVMAIISLLISILLPTLSGARRTGQRVACMALLRGISSGGAEYSADNNDWIVGSPAGSGAYIVNGGKAYGAAVQAWDFMGPLARMWDMGLTFPNLGDDAGVARRFNELRGHKAFLCPSNGFLASWFSGPNAGTNRMVSYNTVRNQLLSAIDADFGADPKVAGLTVELASHNEQLPSKWRPSVNRIGNPANKVFCADGSRYATTSVAPDYDLGATASWGGAFSDPGAYSSWSRSWDRNWVNGSTLGVDARIYAYRHATADPPPGAPGNAFKMNVAFYDGHVETQGDLESANPFQWLPMGSSVETAGGVWADAIAHFRLGGTIERVGP